MRGTRSSGWRRMMVGVEVALLVIEDCPHSRPAAELLRTCLDAVGLVEQRFDTTVVSTQEQAEALGFGGSPTFLIDGADPFAAPGRVRGSVSCRVYATARGLQGLPDRADLERALAEVLGRGAAGRGAAGSPSGPL